MKPSFLIPPTALLLVILFARVTMGAPVDLAWQHAQADPIREALFRHVIKANAGLHPRTIYITLRNGQSYQDPNRRVMNDLADMKSKVRPGSPPREHRPFAAIEGNQTVCLDPIFWQSHQRVEVTGYYWCGIKCGNFAGYIVQYENSHWIVTGQAGETAYF